MRYRHIEFKQAATGVLDSCEMCYDNSSPLHGLNYPETLVLAPGEDDDRNVEVIYVNSDVVLLQGSGDGQRAFVWSNLGGEWAKEAVKIVSSWLGIK